MTSRKHGGFKVARKTAVIDFAEDSPYYGVEATVITSVPFESLFWFQKNANSDDVETTLEVLKQFGENFLVEWNLEDYEGNPCPPTGDGIVRLEDFGLATNILVGWIEAVVTPPDPLSEKSLNSKQSEEALTNLEELSNPLGS